ncbi:hypothetical protein BpHYR1_003107 [Brachionus plicatilis]|uniref:Uncharacterized protein n=1 Tax=Brachionus plicatilis TaxID=10195 RepID=A0A3M7P8V3_BRAPC|nr:hypothetical protein BpHYR1_003107 [Brachionus plicatilis]
MNKNFLIFISLRPYLRKKMRIIRKFLIFSNCRGGDEVPALFVHRDLTKDYLIFVGVLAIFLLIFQRNVSLKFLQIFISVSAIEIDTYLKFFQKKRII